MLFSGNSDLLLQIVKPHLNSSNDFSPLVISFQRFSFLCTSSWLSSTLFSSLSSPLNAFELVLAHLTSVRSTCPFSSQPVEETVLLRPVELPVHSIMVFNIRLRFHSCVMYYRSILLDCWLWVQRSSTLGPQHFFHARMSTWAWAEQLHAPRWIPDTARSGTRHLNMPKWAWAEQLHALPDSPDHMQIWNKRAT